MVYNATKAFETRALPPHLLWILFAGHGLLRDSMLVASEFARLTAFICVGSAFVVTVGGNAGFCATSEQGLPTYKLLVFSKPPQLRPQRHRAKEGKTWSRLGVFLAFTIACDASCRGGLGPKSA